MLRTVTVKQAKAQPCVAGAKVTTLGSTVDFRRHLVHGSITGTSRAQPAVSVGGRWHVNPLPPARPSLSGLFEYLQPLTPRTTVFYCLRLTGCLASLTSPRNSGIRSLLQRAPMAVSREHHSRSRVGSSANNRSPTAFIPSRSHP